MQFPWARLRQLAPNLQGRGPLYIQINNIEKSHLIISPNTHILIYSSEYIDLTHEQNQFRSAQRSPPTRTPLNSQTGR